MPRSRSCIVPSSIGESAERLEEVRSVVLEADHGGHAMMGDSMRAMVDQDIPLNAGCLVPLKSRSSLLSRYFW